MRHHDLSASTKLPELREAFFAVMRAFEHADTLSVHVHEVMGGLIAAGVPADVRQAAAAALVRARTVLLESKDEFLHAAEALDPKAAAEYVAWKESIRKTRRTG